MIKERLKIILLRIYLKLMPIYLKLMRFYLRSILKCRQKHSQAVFLKAYITTFKLFPENKLDHNSKLAQIVVHRFLGIPNTEEIKEVDNEEINKLYESLASDEWVRRTVSNGYRLDAFYYSCANFSGSLRDKADDALAKAKSYDDTALPISQDELSSINKKVKTELKKLRRDVRRLNSERIEKEKLDLIKPVTVTLSQVFPLLYLFSVLFLISGYIYNRFLLGDLGINSSDFFVISDYISSSVDVIESAVIASVLGVLSYLLGVDDDLSSRLRTEQFNIEKTSNTHKYLIALVVFLPIFSLMAVLFIKRELPDNFLEHFYPLIFFTLLYAVYYLPIWKYVKNWFAVNVVVITIFVFLISLGWKVVEDLQDIKNGNYESSYTVFFKKGYEEYSEHLFFASNSNYVFLLNKENQEIAVVPKSAIKALHAKPNEKDNLLR